MTDGVQAFYTIILQRDHMFCWDVITELYLIYNYHFLTIALSSWLQFYITWD